MRIDELFRFKTKEKQFELGEKLRWFENYFQARDVFKRVFEVKTFPIQIPYKQPTHITWNNNFDKKSYQKELRPLLESIGQIPKLLENDDDIKNIKQVSKELLKFLDMYQHIRIVSNESITEFFRRKKTPKPVPIEPYPSDEILGATTGRLDPAQQALSDRLWATREKPRTMLGTAPKGQTFPDAPKSKWQELKNWRKAKRILRNQISSRIKAFVYPRNLIKLISKSEMIIKI